uniref:Cadherin domain-containing protein n=1 Tax=Macrostomum lignano TaxID=282301 RepID=A0A1I8F2L0_9PLAT
NANVSLSIVSGDSVGLVRHQRKSGRSDKSSWTERDSGSHCGLVRKRCHQACHESCGQWSSTPRSSTATLTVLLQDINDSPPRFAIPAGRVLQQAERVCQYIRYPSSALVLNKALNVRVQSSYNLTIICFDGVFSVSTYINISIATGGGNNYSPKFSSSLYAFYVTENDLSSALNQSIGVVSAEDRDTGLNGQVVYSIASPSSLKHLLAINEDTAELQLTVLDVNDNRPEFTAAAYTGSVPEGSTADLSESRDVWKLLQARLSTWFQIEKSRGFRSARRACAPEVSAEPGLHVIASVCWSRVLLEAKVPAICKTAIRPHPSTGIDARDKDIENNSYVEFSLSGPHSNWFSISQSGQIQVASGALLDRENQSSFSLNVTANNTRGEPTWLANSVPVTIQLSDINDNAPVFTKASFDFFIDFFSPVSQTLGDVTATDADAGFNAQITYFLRGGEDRFAIDFRTGVLTVSKALNGSSSNVFSLVVTARDQGTPSLSGTTTVTVYANQTNSNTPIFSPSIYTVSATDADFPSVNGIISYSLLESNSTSGLFSVDSSTGDVSLIGVIDFEKVTSYTVIVLAIDHAAAPRTATAQIFVQVLNEDDTPPEFVPNSYFFYAPQNATVGFAVGSVIAVDPDYPSANPQPVSYSASASDFQLNSTTGALTVSSSLSVTNYFFDAICTDASAMTGNATVTVSVIPSDVYYAKVPQFLSTPLVASVLENQTAYVFVIDVNATINGGAEDAGVLYRLDSGSTIFNISSSLGIVEARPETLDREVNTEVTLIVIAVNTAEPSFSSSQPIRVLLLDINDNAPRFEFSRGEVLLYENATVRHVVTDLQATDPDTSSTNLTYSIVGDNSGGKFRLQSIEPNASQLILDAVVDYEAMSALGYAYSLTIEVSDGSFSSNYSLIVRIGDVNDNPPVFSAPMYNFSVAEQADVGTLVGRVVATDPDTVDLNKLEYAVVDTGNFSMNASTGVISTLTIFDRLITSRFSFNVTCTDTAGNIGWTSVNVDVLDVNNYSPNMTNLPTSWNITENATSLMQSFVIQVVDNDSGQNANVSLSIVSGDSVGSFAINGSRVEVTKVLDRETPGLTVDSSGNGVIKLVMKPCDGSPPQHEYSTATFGL